MSNMIITHFDPEPGLLLPLLDCMDNYGVGNPDAEWPYNLISRKAVRYGSGVIAKRDAPVTHKVSLEEFDLCQRLAKDASAIMDGICVGMYSSREDPFHEFFIVANIDAPVPARIDEALIRERFGGTIFPPATITIEPLEEGGIWWTEVQFDYLDIESLEGGQREQAEKELHGWRTLMRWFGAQTEFVHTAFVRIGDWHALVELPDDEYPAGTELTGCVMPRLALGLTRQGSLAGLFGVSVRT